MIGCCHPILNHADSLPPGSVGVFGGYWRVAGRQVTTLNVRIRKFLTLFRSTQRDVLNHFQIRLWMGTNWNLKIEQFDPFCFRINTFPVSKITVFFNSTAPPFPPYSENKVPSGYFKWSFVTNNQTRNWIAILLCIKYEKIKYLQRWLKLHK